MIDTPGLNGLAESGTDRAVQDEHCIHRADGKNGKP